MQMQVVFLSEIRFLTVFSHTLLLFLSGQMAQVPELILTKNKRVKNQVRQSNHFDSTGNLLSK